MTSGLSSKTIARLIDENYSAERIFSLSHEELTGRCKLKERVADAITGRVAFGAAEREMRHCERSGIAMISRVDMEYPTLLRQIDTPPHVLFAQGDISVLTRNLISMIGTRDCDEDGLKACNMMVGDIAKMIHNAVIVSGLAFGADSYAHRAALAYKIPTVAVLPCALPSVVPASHRYIADAIVEQGGVLLSELHSVQANMMGRGYIARNRIIAGLSKGTILIQSPHKGGAMATMEMARDMGRITMAMPGRIFDYNAKGCNRLISTKEAISVSSADDVIRELGWGDRRLEVEDESMKEALRWLNEDGAMVTTYREKRGVVRGGDVVHESVYKVGDNGEIEEVKEAVTEERKEERKVRSRGNSAEVDLSKLREDQASLLRSMMTSEPIHYTALAKMNPMEVRRLNALLVELELMGMVKSLPGALYQRVVAINALACE